MSENATPFYIDGQWVDRVITSDDDDVVIDDPWTVDAWIYTDTSLPPSPTASPTGGVCWYPNKITVRVAAPAQPWLHFTLTPDQATKLAYRLLTLAYESGQEISE
jgi:hypothetical protein